jgi:DNA polymerase beta
MSTAKDQIIAALEIMEKGDRIRGERFSANAYAKAIKGIKGLLIPILSVEDVKGIPGVGSKIQAKVKEILETGSLQAAERTKRELQLDIYDALLKVHGIGPVKAQQLVKEHGIKSIQDLRANQNLLNDVQKMGLKYYEDINERIPRLEMLEHNRLLQEGLPRTSRGLVVGSFRRMAETSGDIDMLITFDQEVSQAAQKRMFMEYVEKLKAAGYIQDILAKGPKKCMAVVRLKPEAKARRLDLLITPNKEYSYAVLYFTGSDAFNVAFRRHALSRGYTLNEHTLTPTREGVPEPPFMDSENAIFRFLGLEYVAPQNRKGEQNINVVD